MLHIKNLTKTFGKHRVLSSIDLEVASGEIHGLIGVNGSGKSTLLNILFGNPVIRDTGGYTGQIIIGGRPVQVKTTPQAVEAGIGMIHQEFALLPGMTVAENIRIGREPVVQWTRKILGDDFSLVARKRNCRKAEDALARLGVRIDTDLPVLHLPVHMKQFVEIAREIDKTGLKLLLLDEPTAVLNREDAEKLMAALTRFAQCGTAMIFISHRIDEIIRICHRVTVLRNGEISGRFDHVRFDAERVTEAMIGHRVAKTQRIANRPCHEPAIEFENFSVSMPGEEIRNLNLTVFKGEMLGITGLSGHGKAALGAGVMGLFPTRGNIRLKGETIRQPAPSTMISKGLGFLPEDRRNMGLLMDHSVMDNILFTAMQQKNRFLRRSPIKALSLMDHSKASVYTEECVKRFGIGCRSIHQRVSELSGGNQQKVCIARLLALSPGFLFVSEPTRGVDVAAKEIILRLFLTINNTTQATFVIASSELEELKRICNRIAVFYKGGLLDILSPERHERDFARAFSGEKV